jgi:holliday junction DNA helicase RuvB
MGVASCDRRRFGVGDLLGRGRGGIHFGRAGTGPHYAGLVESVNDVAHNVTRSSLNFGLYSGYILDAMSRAEITTPDVLAEESVVELSLRPQRLAEFIGQQKVKESLRIYVDAALARREPLDHTLFFGPPGLGKTTLAELMARELGVNIRATSGPALEKPGDLVGTLTNLRRGDILFIDEIHRLRPIIEEFLYPAMEDYRIDIRLSEGPRAQTITMPVEPFTLVGATTRLGMLTPPLRARFGIEQRLNYYPTEDLELIVCRTADVMQVQIDAAGASEIARRARGTPRVANRLLRRIRDFAQVKAEGRITQAVAKQALQLLDVDIFGLDDMDSRILRTIIEKFDGGPVGVSSVAAAIGEDANTIEEVYEPFLVQNGFLQRTPRGRAATPQAYRHFGYTMPSVPGQTTLF